jgi:glycosyltransferase involved in cell wall biosynthesis
MARGAQTYAEKLVNVLDGHQRSHEIFTVYKPGSANTHRVLGLNVAALIRVRHELRRRRPSIVVAHGGESLKYAVLAAPRSTPVIYYKIGLSGRSLRPRWRLRLYRWLAGRAAVTAVVSDELADEARSVLGVRSDRVVTILNGRDPALFHPGLQDGVRTTSQSMQLLYVGHLNQAKRPMVLLDLVEHLASSGQPVTAVVAGDGPLLDEMRRRAAGLAVDVLGPSDDVPRLLRESDVLIFPSGGDFEGLPGVLIEAGLAGVPAVATDVTGARAVIEDGVTGHIVPIDDLDALVMAVEGLMRDPARRVEMGRRARDRCLARFSMDASAHAWSELVESVLTQRRPAVRR